MHRLWAYVGFPVVALIGLGIVWQWSVTIAGTPDYLVPTPIAVFKRLIGDFSFFAGEGLITLYESVAGFGLGSLVAVLLGTVMAHSRALEKTILPIAILAKVTPIIAIAPLFVIWFGFGSAPKILIAGLITFFPVMINTVVGLRTVQQGSLDFLRSLNASSLQVFWVLRIPSALPFMFAAFRIALPLSVVGAVVGEWFAGDRGLGSVIIVAHNNLDTPTVFAAIMVLGSMGVVLSVALTLVERRFLFWHESSAAD